MPATQNTLIYNGAAIVHFHEGDPRYVIEVALKLTFKYPSMMTRRCADTGVAG
jgi:hypothetical protein